MHRRGRICQTLRDRYFNPLTVAQRDIWIGQVLDPASDFLTASCLEYFGTIDVSLLEQALRQTVGENDGLHLNFVSTKDGPRQYFRPVADFDIPIFDSAARRIREVRRWLGCTTDRAKAFDLANGALLRYAIIKTAPDRFFLYGAIHHLIIDWFGASLFLRRIGEVYSALVKREEPPSPDAPSFSQAPGGRRSLSSLGPACARPGLLVRAARGSA